MVDLKEIKAVHMVGIGGIGVSALGRFFADQGVSLSGSDVVLPRSGILPHGDYVAGHHAENLPPETDLLIYSPAVSPENPELIRAGELGIPVLDYPQALALVTSAYDTIAVSGTHGKSTTTALAGLFFAAAGLDPTVIVGAVVPEFGSNFREGKGDLFIVEACEYRRHMLRLSPQTIILTNIELDHPDYYRDLDDVVSAFRTYVAKLSDEDLLIYHRDNAQTRDVAENVSAIKISFGIGAGADLFAHNVETVGERTTFDLVWKGQDLGSFVTRLPGIYNIANILAATAALLAYGGKVDAVREVLENFNGIGRRFEYVGQMSGGQKVISDYAHHPTALREAVRAGEGRYPDARLLTVFQPHQRERTLRLWDDFVRALAEVPHLILVEPYAPPGREETMEKCGRRLVDDILLLNPDADVVFAEDVAAAEKIVREIVRGGDVILVAGAGDIDKLARTLAEDGGTLSENSVPA